MCNITIIITSFICTCLKLTRYILNFDCTYFVRHFGNTCSVRAAMVLCNETLYNLKLHMSQLSHCFLKFCPMLSKDIIKISTMYKLTWFLIMIVNTFSKCTDSQLNHYFLDFNRMYFIQSFINTCSIKTTLILYNDSHYDLLYTRLELTPYILHFDCMYVVRHFGSTWSVKETMVLYNETQHNF